MWHGTSPSQRGSAVLDVSLPSSWDTPSLLTGRVAWGAEKAWLWVSTALQQLKHPCAITTSLTNNPNHSTGWASVKKISFLSAKTMTPRGGKNKQTKNSWAFCYIQAKFLVFLFVSLALSLDTTLLSDLEIHVDKIPPEPSLLQAKQTQHFQSLHMSSTPIPSSPLWPISLDFFWYAHVSYTGKVTNAEQEMVIISHDLLTILFLMQTRRLSACFAAKVHC